MSDFAMDIYFQIIFVSEHENEWTKHFNIF